MEIKHEFKLNVKPQVIYEAVRTQNGIQGWWCKNSKVGEEVGTESLLHFVKEGMNVDMGFVTKVLEEDEKVIWECISMPNPAWVGTRIITEIQQTSDGCDVVFSHAGFDDKWKGQDAFEQTKGTWKNFVESLKDYCEKGEGQPW